MANKSNWRDVRLRDVLEQHSTLEQRQALANAQQVSFLPMEAIGEQGELNLSIVRDKELVQVGYTLFFEGDVLVAKITPCFENGKGAVASNLLNGVGFGTTELHVLRPSSETDPRFLYYITASQPFRAMGEANMTGAAGQKRVPTEFVYNFRISLPPLPTQRAIAAYLDRETARIDAMIDAKQRLLALLVEKRRALITHAVTRGLDPDAPMRDSGVPWIGEVPAHWGTEGFTRFLKSQIDYRGRTPEKTDTGVFLITARNVRDGYIDYSLSQEYIALDDYEDVMARGKPKIGDILFTTEAPLGQVALVDREDVALAQRIIKLDYEETILQNKFVMYWFMSTAFQWHLNSLSTGSTAVGIKASKLSELWNVIPKIEEQLQIIEYIGEEEKKLNKLQGVTLNTVSLLYERRAALIAAAVTGQINIP